MDVNYIMDNDSGYISHNPESNLDNSTENSLKTKQQCSGTFMFLSEDALLERPVPTNFTQSSGSVLDNSEASLKTEFSGFDDSDTDWSGLVPKVDSIVWDPNVPNGECFFKYLLGEIKLANIKTNEQTMVS